ncbi:hypothetical protein LUZ60_016832 [Juncus effusus]|nr:hypothetical protein LUZ60_016832 [Juncus effusus]
MGSTGEPDRKRRHFSSVSPTAAAANKKQPCSFFSDDKKLDLSVLKYKNQKLGEQLEAKKLEYHALETKYIQLRDKQKEYRDTLELVKGTHQKVVGELESVSVSVCKGGLHNLESDGASSSSSCSSSIEREFINRIMEKGATESTSNYEKAPNQSENQLELNSGQNELNTLTNALTDAWRVNNRLGFSLLSYLLNKVATRYTEGVEDMEKAFKSMDNIQLMHKELWDKIQSQRESNLRNKAELRRLREEFESTIAELDETNRKLIALKSQRDISNSAPLLFPTFGNNNINNKNNNNSSGVSFVDRQSEVRNLEAAYKEQMELVSKRLVEIERLHEERIGTLRKLATFQNILTDIKGISSSKAFELLNEHLAKSQSEIEMFRSSIEKLQVEKERFIWREKEVFLKGDLAEINQKKNHYYETRVSELELEMQKLTNERSLMERKLEEALHEPGRKQIIAEFKALVASLPNEMSVMQNELTKYKNISSELHLMRAEVHSLTSILNRKENELEALSSRFSLADSEIKRLKAMARDVTLTNRELKLFLEAFKQESLDPKEIMEAKDREYQAWAKVETLKLSLAENNLEIRVKEANEAEALSQQRLASSEAEIADLRQKLEASRRDLGELSENLKSKDEESESYLSEIESIGQAYEDMQTQNQQLLQQITERDDHNTKLVMEGVKAKQALEALRFEVQTLRHKVQNASSLLDSYKGRVLLLEDHLKAWADQLTKLEHEKWQNSANLSSAQRKITDLKSESQNLRQNALETQSKVEKSRNEIAELLIDLDKERFGKKRVEDELEAETRKLSALKEKMEGSSSVNRLKEEARELRGILKCGLCSDRQKEVVIAKCYHLFCNQCVQKTLENRQRKCPSCGLSFGPNDVKPIYI